jgi:hypothetical protein
MSPIHKSESHFSATNIDSHNGKLGKKGHFQISQLGITIIQTSRTK